MEDKEIIKLYLDRNEKAIAATSEKYGSYCETISVNILKNDDDAEECVNDTYMKTWNAIPPQIPVIFSAFLGKIVRNISFNKYRHNNSQKRGGSEMPLILDELGEIVSGKESVEDEIDHKELLRAINGFLNSLPEHKRGIFIRRYWYSDKVSDIAQRYGRSENSVSVELNRVRKNLREYLLKRGFEL